MDLADKGLGVQHFCTVCQNTEEAGDCACIMQERLIEEATNSDFMPQRWQKVVKPLQIWTTLFAFIGNMPELCKFVGIDKDDDDNEPELGKRKSRFKKFAEDEHTPFVLGVKLHALADMQPLAMQAVSHASSVDIQLGAERGHSGAVVMGGPCQTAHLASAAAAASAGSGGPDLDAHDVEPPVPPPPGAPPEDQVPASKHPLSKLSNAYRQYRESQTSAFDPETFTGAGLEYICSLSKVTPEKTALYVRTEYLAIWAEAEYRFGPFLETYPALQVISSFALVLATFMTTLAARKRMGPGWTIEGSLTLVRGH